MRDMEFRIGTIMNTVLMCTSDSDYREVGIEQPVERL